MKKKNLLSVGSLLYQKLPPMHLACSTDELRPNLCCVHIEDGIATATDAYQLIRYDLKELLEEDVLKAMNGKLIHWAAWKLMCTVNTFWIRANDQGGIFIHSYKGIRDCHIQIGFVDEKYPDFHAITAPVFSSAITEAKDKISLNAKHLGRISKVLSYVGEPESHNLRLWFNKGNQAIVVTLAGNEDGVAILMPIYWDCTPESRVNVQKFMKKSHEPSV